MKVTAIIVAAGSSRRMGFDKLSALIDGRSVLSRSLAAFQACEQIDEIVLVGNEAALSETAPAKLAAVVPGGSERHHSVAAGLKAAAADGTHIAVHDGARPLVTPAAIAAAIDGATEPLDGRPFGGAASLAHRITDTLKRADETNASAPMVTDSVSRDHLWAMETPQVFDAALLREAYQKILSAGELVTDEVSAVQSLGRRVKLVENPAPNPKVTFPGDIALCEALLSLRTDR